MAIRQPTAKFQGIYGIPEAARYLVVTPPLANGRTPRPAQLRYWIRTCVSPVAAPFLPTRQRFITFRDLVSMRMIAILRSRGVRLREIREAERWMHDTLHIEWPLISKPLWTYASDVYIKFHQHLIAASRSGQQAMQFLESWLSRAELDMTFDENNLVSSWLVSRDVRIDPRIQFGEPCIDGTRIPTDIISGKIQAGDTPEVLARLYGVSRAQIQHAIEWEERFATV